MNAALVSVLVLIGAVIILVGAASFLERRAKNRGNLFTGHASMTSRIIAFIFGALFGGVFIYQVMIFNEYTVVFPILAFAFFAYSLGWNRIIDSVQKLKK
jgi:hypothetical protein